MVVKMLELKRKENDFQIMSVFINEDGLCGMQALVEQKKIVYIIPRDDETIQFPEHFGKGVFLKFWKNEKDEFFANYRTTSGRVITVNKNLVVVGVK